MSPSWSLAASGELALHGSGAQGSGANSSALLLAPDAAPALGVLPTLCPHLQSMLPHLKAPACSLFPCLAHRSDTGIGWG